MELHATREILPEAITVRNFPILAICGFSNALGARRSARPKQRTADLGASVDEMPSDRSDCTAPAVARVADSVRTDPAGDDGDGGSGREVRFHPSTLSTIDTTPKKPGESEVVSMKASRFLGTETATEAANRRFGRVGRSDRRAQGLRTTPMVIRSSTRKISSCSNPSY
jgi:hypothetical protein